MTGGLLHQRCWNHELREAVCRCPACGRHFCRECVTEHETRLLCAACLLALAQVAPASRSPGRSLWTPVAAAGGLLLSWLVFYIGGEILLELAAHAERTWRIP
ncbi:MAG TPA: hypothetical protein VMR62_21580 [Bryobacteraceae bacterium]|nr:hypothetical protein [Bryobacteraceae bacterium]